MEVIRDDLHMELSGKSAEVIRGQDVFGQKAHSFNRDALTATRLRVGSFLAFGREGSAAIGDSIRKIPNALLGPSVENGGAPQEPARILLICANAGGRMKPIRANRLAHCQ